MGSQDTRRRSQKSSDDVSLDEIREALLYVAYLVEKYGDAYAPILDRLEREFIAAQARETPRSRAQRILETYSFNAGRSQGPGS